MLIKLTAALVVLGTSALFVPQADDPTQDRDGRYTVDTNHSSVLFRIQHLGAAYFWGRFNEVSGSLLVDHESPANSSVRITVPASSIDTGNKGRDEHLRGPDFFDARQFPNIEFESTKVKKARAGVARYRSLRFFRTHHRPILACGHQVVEAPATLPTPS